MGILLLAVAPALALMLAGALAGSYNDLWWELEVGLCLALGDHDNRLLMRGPWWPK